LFELLQNFQFLTPEQQQQLQIILEQRMPGMMQPASSAAGNDR
jgi:Spy/CpxP family protein refolding chaperone